MTDTLTEEVVLLSPDGARIGTADKATVHSADTPLHLAFSCHVFAPDGRVLVTRRALEKLTFAGIWTNSFCGHPSPGEDMAEAVARRADRELGLVLDDVRVMLPDFRYRATDAGGIVENEICPVFRADAVADPHPAADEVADWRWVEPAALVAAVTLTPWAYSPWLSLQLSEWDDYRA